ALARLVVEAVARTGPLLAEAARGGNRVAEDHELGILIAAAQLALPGVLGVVEHERAAVDPLLLGGCRLDRSLLDARGVATAAELRGKGQEVLAGDHAEQAEDEETAEADAHAPAHDATAATVFEVLAPLPWRPAHVHV